MAAMETESTYPTAVKNRANLLLLLFFLTPLSLLYSLSLFSFDLVSLLSFFLFSLTSSFLSDCVADFGDPDALSEVAAAAFSLKLEQNFIEFHTCRLMRAKRKLIV